MSFHVPSCLCLCVWAFGLFSKVNFRFDLLIALYLLRPLSFCLYRNNITRSLGLQFYQSFPIYVHSATSNAHTDTLLPCVDCIPNGCPNFLLILFTLLSPNRHLDLFFFACLPFGLTFYCVFQLQLLFPSSFPPPFFIQIRDFRCSYLPIFTRCAIDWTAIGRLGPSLELVNLGLHTDD